MTRSVELSDSDRQRLARALVQDRYQTADLSADSIAEHVDNLLQFTPGEVPPDEPEFLSNGVAVAGPSLDRTFDDIFGDTKKRAWPTGAPMAIAVTHDVDLFDGLSHFGLRAAGWVASSAQALLRGQVDRFRSTVERASQWTRWWATNKDPVNDISAWQALEAEHGIRSTFFFLSLAKALSKEGRLYRADDPRVIRVLKSLHSGGWEVGLHAARYESDTTLGLERQRVRLENALGTAVKAIRYHYLTASFPDAWRHMADAGFTVSSNVGFHPPYQGFRTGTAWPYRPLAHQGNALFEMPMALMDVAHGPARTQLSCIFDWLCTQTTEVGGLLVINFHTNYIADIDAPAVHQQFREILGKIKTMVTAGQAVTLTMSEAVDHLMETEPLAG